MPTILGVPFDPRAILAGLVFALLATVGLVAFQGAYEALFPLLMGWLAVFVVVAKRVLGDGEDDGPEPEAEDG